MLNCDQYLMPETLDGALNALSEAPSGSRIVAGATDTLPWARQGRGGDVSGDAHVPTLIDISRISELNGSAICDNGRVRIGANVVFQQFLEDDFLIEQLPGMPSCALWFADDQIRRQATLAGNLANASPAADGVPPMIALNADLELARLENGNILRRTVPLAEFITGPGKTVLDEGDVITTIICDSAKGFGGAFEKVGHRRSLVISVVCAFCCVKPSADRAMFEDIRLALGGIGPVPVRLDDVEDFLKGKPISAATIEEASTMPVDRVASRTRQEYRRDVVRGFIARAIRAWCTAAGIHPYTNTSKVPEAHRCPPTFWGENFGGSVV